MLFTHKDKYIHLHDIQLLIREDVLRKRNLVEVTPQIPKSQAPRSRVTASALFLQLQARCGLTHGPPSERLGKKHQNTAWHLTPRRSRLWWPPKPKLKPGRPLRVLLERVAIAGQARPLTPSPVKMRLSISTQNFSFLEQSN